MKTKLLFCSFLLLFFLGEGAAVAAERKIIDLKTKEIIRPRTISIIPVNASIENCVITLDFIYPFESVAIEITNIDDGYPVYYNVIANQDNFVIDLTGEDSGYYRLELVIDGKRYGGEFWLE